ncbi:MAG: protein-tyrosine phosphatase family protein [Pseudomonadota bacterium]
MPEAARNYVSDSFGPRGFLWLKKGVLAGTPMPGVFYEEEYDVQALQRVEITHLVTLTMPPPKERDVTETLLESYGITRKRFSIEDMGAPDYEQALKICQHLDAEIKNGQKVAVHCKAGMGRTGTVLCMYMIWQGKEAMDALEQARNIEPRWVQSAEQVHFLEAFEKNLSGSREKVR